MKLKITGGTFKSNIYGMERGGINESNTLGAKRGNITIEITDGTFEGENISAMQETEETPIMGDYTLKIGNSANFTNSNLSLTAENVEGESKAIVPDTLIEKLDENFGRTIYVSNSGNDSNNGLTNTSPVKTLGKAFELCKNYGGNIVIAGEVEIGNNNLESCKKTVTITGKWDDKNYNGTILAKNNITMNSNVKIENIVIKPTGNQTIYANGNNLSIGENVSINEESGNISIDGGDKGNTIEIKSGKWANIISGKTDSENEYNIIYVKGGNISNIFATNQNKETQGNVNILIEGGNVENISTGESNIKGNLGILIIDSENDIAIQNQNNVQGSYELSNYKNNQDASKNVYFVKDGTNGDGSNPNNSLSSINQAIEKLENKTGTIVICGELTIENSLVLSQYNNLTITSVYKNIDYAKTNNAHIRLGYGIWKYIYFKQFKN